MNFAQILRAQWPIAIEAGLLLVALAVALVRPGLGSRAFRQVELALGQLARKRGLAVLAVTLIALAGRGALLPIVPIPAPAVHDEFSYLLMADTFASGRLSNPTHPMWKHFESFHIIHQPTYSSKYPAAQGVFLAMGQVFAGHPWFGVWLSAGLMCGAICWMLQGWLPPGWALLGGIIAVIRLSLFSYWVNSYWGGAVAAIGGCLVLGALGRMLRTIGWRDALWMGLGAGILANSRPYEGMLVCLGAAAVLLVRIGWRSLLVRAAPPMLIVLALTAAAMGYYFNGVTGNPFRNPYQVHEIQYNPVPLPGFLWQTLHPQPAYRHQVMQAFNRDWAELFLTFKSAKGFSALCLFKLKSASLFFLGPALGIGLLAGGCLLRDRRTRPLLVILLLSTAGMAGQFYFNPHYLAPIVGLFLTLLLQGFRHVRVWRLNGRPTGLFLTRAAPIIFVLMVAVRIAAQPGPHEWSRPRFAQWCCADEGNTGRERLIANLEATGERHLVMVRYKPDHPYDNEWVYNAADIDAAKVVFAREIDPAGDRDLIAYFKDRRVWLVEPDQPVVPLTPYGGPARSGR